MKTATQFKILITVLACLIFLPPVISILGSARNAYTVHSHIDPNCMEIRYYTDTQKIHIMKNDEAETELTFNMNGGSFGILKGQLIEEGWIFNRQRGDTKGDTDINQFHWRGIRIKK